MHKSYVKGPTSMDDSIIWYKSISDLLKHHASLIPEREAFVVYHSTTQRESITYSEVYEKSRKFAAVLISLGIKKRAKVVFCLRKSIEFIISQFGVLMIGAIPVNINVTAYATSEMHKTLKKIKPSLLILEKNFPGTTTELKDLKLEFTSLKHIIATDVCDDDDVCLSYCSLLMNDSTVDGSTNVEVNLRDVAITMKTSGTTAKPKYISLSYEPLLRLPLSDISTIEGEIIKLFSNCALSHAGGHPLKSFKCGRTTVLMHGHWISQQLQTILDIVEKECCNVLDLSFSYIRKIVKYNLRIPASVKVIILGGTPLSKDMGKLLDQVPILYCNYGTNESGFIASVRVKNKDEMENNLGGFAVNNVEIKIVDKNGCVVDKGISGNIMVRTKNACLSIMRHSDEVEEMVEDEWVDTKDTGYISNDGKVYVLGRDNDVLNIDSKNRHVAILENAFREFEIDGIEDLVVLPIPDSEYYQRVCVCIIKTPGSSLTEKEFLDTCREKKLVNFLMPKYVLFMDSFPMTANDKVRRNVLLEQVMNDIIPNKTGKQHSSDRPEW